MIYSVSRIRRLFREIWAAMTVNQKWILEIVGLSGSDCGRRLVLDKLARQCALRPRCGKVEWQRSADSSPSIPLLSSLLIRWLFFLCSVIFIGTATHKYQARVKVKDSVSQLSYSHVNPQYIIWQNSMWKLMCLRRLSGWKKAPIPSESPQARGSVAPFWCTAATATLTTTDRTLQLMPSTAAAVTTAWPILPLLLMPLLSLTIFCRRYLTHMSDRTVIMVW